MFRRLGLVCAGLAFFGIAGGHWAVMQTIAWSEMLHSISASSGSLTTAVEQTFDGRHPCELCRKIQTAKAHEGKQTPADQLSKASLKALPCAVALTQLPAEKDFRHFDPAALAAISRSDAPLTPPPRLVLSAA